MQQQALFAGPTVVPPVPGLSYVEQYIDEAEERALLAAIDAQPWSEEWKRRRQIYGMAYGAPGRGGAPVATAIPEWLHALGARLARDGWLERAPENVVVNEYLPGQGIAAHHDYAVFGGKVAAVSLGAPCVLDLRDPETAAHHPLDLAPRSLFVLAGDARTRWTHGIAPRLADVVSGTKRPRARRVSVTFRTRC